MIRRPLLLLCVLSCLGHWRDVSAGEISNPRKIRAAITSISGSMVPPWAAHEAGIFKKYGLQVEVIATPSGVQGTNALIAGEVSFVQIAGGTTTGAAVGGADLKIVATMVGTLVLNLSCSAGDRKTRTTARQEHRHQPLRHFSSHRRTSRRQALRSRAGQRRAYRRDRRRRLDCRRAAGQSRASRRIRLSGDQPSSEARQSRDAASPVAQHSLRFDRGFDPRRNYPRRSRSRAPLSFGRNRSDRA